MAKRSPLCLAVLVATVFPTPAKADGPASLVVDLDPGTASWPQPITQIAVSRQLGYFVFPHAFQDAASGQAVGDIGLWKTDGTAAGTLMMKDLTPWLGLGWPNPALPNPNWTNVAAVAPTVSLSGFNHGLYFLASDPNATWLYGDDEVWQSDGSSAGTLQLAAYPSSSGGDGYWQCGATVQDMQLAQDTLYYTWSQQCFNDGDTFDPYFGLMMAHECPFSSGAAFAMREWPWTPQSYET
jgi:ELWxxDGT repeat protein